MKDFSTIILSCNDRDLLRKCLESYAAAENPPTSEIIVVDNGSKDGTIEMLKKEFPDARIIKNEENLGVARARNQGIRASTGKHLLFLDSDTEIHNGALSKLFEFIERNRDVAVVGPKLVNTDGTLQYSARRFPNPATFLLRGFRVGENSRLMKKHLMYDLDYGSPQETDWLIGAAWFVRRSAFRDVGLFDEKYFFGYEDSDFCYRAKKKGWKIIHNPGAVITHQYKRRSAHRGPFNKLKWAHGWSALRFFRKKYFV